MARRRDPAALLVVGTYRPVEARLHSHPLHSITQELKRQGCCDVLPLTLLSASGGASYLTMRCQHKPTPAGLSEVIHRRTHGNPLFMVSMVDDLIRQDILYEHDGFWLLQDDLDRIAASVPESIRHFIEQQLEQVDVRVQALLEAASVAGATFTAAAVAAALRHEAEVIEAQFEHLARREQFVQAWGTAEWPDGTVTARYRSLHSLYQDVLYDRISAGRRVFFHRQIGKRLETAYRARAREMSAELAVHFVRGRDAERAVRHLQAAGENALHRHAHQQALVHLSTGLDLAKALPRTPGNLRLELAIQCLQCIPLVATQGYGAPEVAHAYDRAYQLCQEVEAASDQLPMLYGLFRFYSVRSEHDTAYALACQLARLAKAAQDPLGELAAQIVQGSWAMFTGHLSQGRHHFEAAVARYDVSHRDAYILLYGEDLGIVCFAFTARVLWYLGYWDQARGYINQLLQLAEEQSEPVGLAFANTFAAWFHLCQAEWQPARAHAESAFRIAAGQGVTYWLATSRMLRGRILLEQGPAAEAIAQMEQGLSDCEASGAKLERPFWLIQIADAYGRLERPEVGLSLLEQAKAQMETTGERWYESELFRVMGGLQQAIGRDRLPSALSPELCFHRALQIAAQQQSITLELAAAMSLSRLWQGQGRRHEAHTLLMPIYQRFTEGLETPLLQEANMLLERLSARLPQHTD